MPFTPSHAVVALAFTRTPLIPAAIAIGAMTPDLPLFLRGAGPDYGFTHGPANAVWTGLIAFGLFLLWRILLRPAAAELTPTRLARRLPAEWDVRPSDAAAAALGRGAGRGYPALLAFSLLLGVLSHIGWDLFTHEGRAGVAWLPVLDAAWGPLPGYRWLQHGSGVVGLAVIAIAGLLWVRRQEDRPAPARLLPVWVRRAWWAALPGLLLVAMLFGYAAYGPFDAAFTPQHLAYRVLPPACALWGALTVGLCLVIALLRARRRSS